MQITCVELREVFAAANRARLPIVVHVRNGDSYGAPHARVFLEELLTAAPDIPVQIAHLWGGANFSADALAVYAEAVAARRPATRRLYFDVSDAALVANTPELAQVVADRIRQIGLDRIFYGSDAAFGNHPDPARLVGRLPQRHPLERGRVREDCAQRGAVSARVAVAVDRCVKDATFVPGTSAVGAVLRLHIPEGAQHASFHRTGSGCQRDLCADDV